jgi:zinc D-Ala-D-Ala carboxypeptidase
MNLSEHFTLEELTSSSTALRKGIDNHAPNEEVMDHLRVLASGLERVRAILGAALHIDSGYRSPALNKAVGGVATSAHITGYAADFICPGYGTPLQVVKILTEPHAMEFDQIIQEGTWVHISFVPAMRRSILTAHFVDGKARYENGV